MSESDPKNSLEPQTAAVHIKAGPQRVSAAFVQKLRGAARRPADAAREHAGRRQHRASGVTMLPHLRDFDGAAARSPSPACRTRASRRRIFTCRPTTRGRRSRRAPTEIVQRAGDAGVPRPGAAGRPRRADGVLRAGPQEGRLRARHPPRAAGDPGEPALPVPPRGSAGDGARRRRAIALSDQDLASRLSFFLWGTVPDAELLKAAAAGHAADAGRRSTSR